jgi:hypothetical protein
VEQIDYTPVSFDDVMKMTWHGSKICYSQQVI